MAITRWIGGRTGIEVMPEGYTTLYYTEINREVPRLYNQNGTSMYDYGWFNGSTGPTYPEHFTIYPYRPETLVVTVNGTVVNINETSPNSNVFTINSALSGWVRVSYLPYQDSLYYKKTARSLSLSPSRSRLAPTSREIMNEILYAIDALSVRIGTFRERFSIENYTGFPIEFNSNIGITPKTPFNTQLLQEISDNIVILFNYALSAHGAAVVPGTPTTYAAKRMVADTIRNFRSDINTLESALDTLGI